MKVGSVLISALIALFAGRVEGFLGRRLYWKMRAMIPVRTNFGQSRMYLLSSWNPLHGVTYQSVVSSQRIREDSNEWYGVEVTANRLEFVQETPGLRSQIHLDDEQRQIAIAEFGSVENAIRQQTEALQEYQPVTVQRGIVLLGLWLGAMYLILVALGLLPVPEYTGIGR